MQLLVLPVFLTGNCNKMDILSWTEKQTNCPNPLILFNNSLAEKRQLFQRLHTSIACNDNQDLMEE